MLVKAQRRYAPNDVQLVGIGIEQASKSTEYAKDRRIDYVPLAGGAEALGLIDRLGNRARLLPSAVILDRFGNVAYTHAGALTATSPDLALAPMF